jgi:hypothetical protein
VRASIDSIKTSRIDRRQNSTIDPRISIIDRLLSADPRKTDPGDLAHAKRWVYGYQCKFGRNERSNGPYHPHPPDDKVLSQICAALNPIELENFIHEISGESPPPQPGHQYSWYVTVALQRRHGIAPEFLRQRRAELRIVRERGRALHGEQQPLLNQPDNQPGFREEISQQIRSAAAGRKIR